MVVGSCFFFYLGQHIQLPVAWGVAKNPAKIVRIIGVVEKLLRYLDNNAYVLKKEDNRNASRFTLYRTPLPLVYSLGQNKINIGSKETFGEAISELKIRAYLVSTGVNNFGTPPNFTQVMHMLNTCR